MILEENSYRGRTSKGEKSNTPLIKMEGAQELSDWAVINGERHKLALQEPYNPEKDRVRQHVPSKRKSCKEENTKIKPMN